MKSKGERQVVRIQGGLRAAKLDLFPSLLPTSSTRHTAGTKCLLNGPQVGNKRLQTVWGLLGKEAIPTSGLQVFPANWQVPSSKIL